MKQHHLLSHSQYSLNRTASAIWMYNGKVMYSSDKVSLIVVILF